jgi:hypothetical protein
MTGDGIGDTPFTLATGIGDPAPLMQPASNYFGDSGPSIPEFPSIALPVAAVLGLVAVFGRKKEI